MSAESTQIAPARVLGTFSAACVVIGAIIGVGIFFNPSKIAALVGSGPAVLLAWSLAGFIALCGALAFAELGTRFNASGAQYDVLRTAYGPFPAFLFVFCNATAIQTGAIAVIATVCVRNLGVAARGEEPTGWMMLASAGVVIVGITLANIVGVRLGAAIQNATVIAKVLTLLAVIALAGVGGSRPVDSVTAAPAAMHPAAAVMAALVPAFFAYGGWQHALWISGEVKEPRRTLPRAIIGGVVIVVLVYVLANWAYLKLLGVEGMATSKTLAADAVAAAGPSWAWGRRVIAGAVGLSAFGVLNAQLLSGPRLVYAMANDGRFFGVFGRLSPRFGTPAAAIGLLGGLGLVLLYAAGPGGIDRLIAGAVAIDSVFFAATGAALLLVMKRSGSWKGTVPLAAAAALIFAVCEIGVATGSYLDRESAIGAATGFAWIVGAAAVYAVWFRR